MIENEYDGTLYKDPVLKIVADEIDEKSLVTAQEKGVVVAVKPCRDRNNIFYGPYGVVTGSASILKGDYVLFSRSMTAFTSCHYTNN